MYLPTEEEASVFRENLPDSLEVLRGSLIHKNSHTRMCAAHMIQLLKSDARTLAPALRNAFESEAKAINQVYFVGALVEIGDATDETRELLRTAFKDEGDDQLRTRVAGALVVLWRPDDDPEAWKWLIESLQSGPARPFKSRSASGDYWERPCGAAESLSKLKQRNLEAVEALQTMHEDPHTPNWVKRKIKGALSALERLP